MNKSEDITHIGTTVALLTGIAIALAVFIKYCYDADEIQGLFAFMLMPTVVLCLLIGIIFFSTRGSYYRKFFTIIIIIWLIIFASWFYFISWAHALGQAMGGH